MRAVSIHVDDRDYQRFKVLASKSGRSVADLIREAMATFLAQRGQLSILDIAPVEGGVLLAPWTREELYDEMTSP